MAFVKLKDWSERDADNGVMPITGRAMAALGQIKDAFIFAFPPPAIPELGTASGYTFFLKDNSGQGHEALQEAGQRAPERPGRHAAVPHRHRCGQGDLAGAVDRPDQRHPGRRVGQFVHR
ncbi:hypothetical protein G6F60_014850 [Rhizopus arrhizus]|nr:hypothetical protein G6F60_014850 [Rhizopus arrhizus]